MMNQIIKKFNGSSKDIYYYPAGTQKIAFDKANQIWTITNDDNASKFIQILTEKLKIGDIITIEFDCAKNVDIIVENIIGVSEEHNITSGTGYFEDHFKIKLPCITSDKKRISIGLKQTNVQSVSLSNIIITIESNVVPPTEKVSLQATLRKDNNVWIKRVASNSDDFAVIDKTTYLEITFSDSLAAWITVPCVFVTPEWAAGYVGLALPAYQTQNSCTVKFFDMAGTPVNPSVLPNGVTFSILMR